MICSEIVRPSRRYCEHRHCVAGFEILLVLETEIHIKWSVFQRYMYLQSRVVSPYKAAKKIDQI